ncbi:MAG TPA: hypothetical protein DCF70_09065 [Treponema sp.]|nr:hypothetical protein [Treponema sp.]
MPAVYLKQHKLPANGQLIFIQPGATRMPLPTDGQPQPHTAKSESFLSTLARHGCHCPRMGSYSLTPQKAELFVNFGEARMPSKS